MNTTTCTEPLNPVTHWPDGTPKTFTEGVMAMRAALVEIQLEALEVERLRKIVTVLERKGQS